MVEEQEQQDGQNSWKSLLQMFLMAVVVSRLFGGSQQQQPVVASTSKSRSLDLSEFLHIEYGKQSLVRSLQSDPQKAAMISPFHNTPGPHHSNLFVNGTEFDLQVYLSHLEDLPEGTFHTAQELIWHEKELKYVHGETQEREFQMNWTIPDDVVVKNQTGRFIHVYLTAKDHSPSPVDITFHPLKTIHQVMPLITYRPREKTPAAVRHLLDDSDQEETSPAVDENDDTYAIYWKPAFRIHVIHDFTMYNEATMVPFLNPYLQVDRETGGYLPMVFLNEFWTLHRSHIALNGSLDQVPLSIQYYPLSIAKFALYVQMQTGFDQQHAMGTSTMHDTDGMKALLLDTNPYLLAVTFLVSILHMLFDFLAFKNDVSFWKKRKSFKGLSLRTVCVNTFFQAVIFLYLLDNDTSYMILVSSGIGVAIELWKIRKAYLMCEGAETREEYHTSPTAQYDKIAVNHLSYAMYPLMIGYSLYTLVYRAQKGWYSWILKSLVGFVYAFGFIMMTPQLYINYRMKSVAHMPWRAMVYKSLNTFIDDLFAFVIEMPIMHRLACFRDDLIFFIYLYQKYKYPVDTKRVNEYGQTAEATEEEDS